MPPSLDEAMQVAITLSNAERMKQSDTKSEFSAQRDEASQAVVCFSCRKRGHCMKDYRFKRKDGSSKGMIAPKI
jgi:hypothetical protein